MSNRIVEIDNEIRVLRAKLPLVKGLVTEVYTRIVGYYRAVKNWNPGKKEEFATRKNFVADYANLKDRHR